MNKYEVKLLNLKVRYETLLHAGHATDSGLMRAVARRIRNTEKRI